MKRRNRRPCRRCNGGQLCRTTSTEVTSPNRRLTVGTSVEGDRQCRKNMVLSGAIFSTGTTVSASRNRVNCARMLGRLIIGGAQVNQTTCHKVFAFPTMREARQMLKYARPDQAGRLFNDAYKCRIPGCGKYHMTTKQGPPSRERRT